MMFSAGSYERRVFFLLGFRGAKPIIARCDEGNFSVLTEFTISRCRAFCWRGLYQPSRRRQKHTEFIAVAFGHAPMVSQPWLLLRKGQGIDKSGYCSAFWSVASACRALIKIRVDLAFSPLFTFATHIRSILKFRDRYSTPTGLLNLHSPELPEYPLNNINRISVSLLGRRYVVLHSPFGATLT